MKDRALEIVASRSAAVDGRNVLREYLQSRILGQMQEAGAFVPLAFMGGTALRFLYRIERFSEDLDFALEGDAGGFDFHRMLKRVDNGLCNEGYRTVVKVNASAVGAKSMVGFSGLLAEAGLSPHPEEVLWVRVEVDTNPPPGAGLAVTVVNRFGPLRLHHHDLRSLFAGKIAALFAREYTKGRDLYDLMWYLSRAPRIAPNPDLLRNALLQTAPTLAETASADWRVELRLRLTRVDWVDARRDLAPFLEQPRDLGLIEPPTFAQLLA